MVGFSGYGISRYRYNDSTEYDLFPSSVMCGNQHESVCQILPNLSFSKALRASMLGSRAELEKAMRDEIWREIEKFLEYLRDKQMLEDSGVVIDDAIIH